VVTLEEPDEQILWTSPGIELGSTGCEPAVLPRRHEGRYGKTQKKSYLNHTLLSINNDKEKTYRRINPIRIR
jgi:hypothetical protein